MNIEVLKKYNIPDKPGVYFFMQGQEIIYIGKATYLKDRVRSYFSKDLIVTRGPLILDMVFHADDIKWEEADSVLEALILEANLIKKHQPKYNTKEKDNKSFNYICITKEDLPKVLVVRGREIDFSKMLACPAKFHKGASYKCEDIYGPYTSGSQLKEALKIIRKIFPFIDASSVKKDHYEFYRQIGLTPSIKRVDSINYEAEDLKAKEGYLENIKNVKLFFEGKKKKILDSLKKTMMLSAKNQDFEKAGEIKNQIFALTHINDIALIKDDFKTRIKEEGGSHIKDFRIEAYDIAHMSGKDMVGVMVVVENSEPNKSEYRKFKIRNFKSSNDTGALGEVLKRRFNHDEWQMPDLIAIDGGKQQLNAAKNVLSDLKLNIPIVSVVKDERHKPKEILGAKSKAFSYQKDIILANAEAHRFAIGYHKLRRGKNFLGK